MAGRLLFAVLLVVCLSAGPAAASRTALTPQTITFTSTPPISPEFVNNTYLVTATATSNLPVTFSVDATSVGCTYAPGPGLVTFTAEGTCVIDADQGGNATFKAAPQVQQSIVVAKNPNSITFFPPPFSPAQIGGPSWTPVASATSGQTVAFSVDASSTGCSYSAGTGVVSFLSPGTCVIDANDPGNTAFAAAPQAQRSIQVVKATNTITFFPPPNSPSFVGSIWNPSAFATSGNTVLFSVDATSTGCTYSAFNNQVSFTSVGTCVIDANDPGNLTFAAAATVKQSIPVAKAPNAITFAPPPVTPAQVGTSWNPQAGATSGLQVQFSVDGTSTGCTYQANTNVVIFNSPGTCVIDANEPGNNFFAAAPQVQRSVPVVGGPQTVSITSTPQLSPELVGNSYQPTVTSSSGLPPVVTVDAASTGCSVVGGGPFTVLFTAPGTCIVDANQPGNFLWAPAPQVQQTIQVTKRPNSITITSNPAFSPAIVGSSYTPTATATSTRPVMFSVDAASTGCTVLGPNVQFTAVGTCILDANEPGDDTWAAAPQKQQTIVVVGASQTVSITSTPPVQPAPVGSTYTPAGTASPSNLTVQFSIDAASTAGCSLTGGIVTFVSPGTCIIDANQPGNAQWAAAPQVQQSVLVVGQPNVITFTTTPSQVPAPAGTTYTPAASASSNLPVTLSLDVTSTGCSFSGGIVTFTGTGTCKVDANQSGNASFAAATQVQQTIPVVTNPNVITFTSTPSTVPAPIGTTYTPTATATSNLPVTLTLDLSSTGCSLNAGVVTFISTGTCKIDANQPGNQFYAAAAQVQQSVPIAKASQTITFTSTPPASAASGGQYTATAVASSGLPVTYSLDGSSSGCTLNGQTVTFTGVGGCVIDADQGGNSNFKPAPTVQQTIVVRLSQTITITSFAPNPASAGGTYQPTATADSGLLVAITLDASSAGCTLSGGLVSFTGIGTCVVDYDQAGNTTYAAAPQKHESIVVGKGTQTITFTSNPPFPAAVGGTYKVAATASSGLTVTFTRDAASTGCTLSGKTVTFTGVGTCKIDANQAGNASYFPATQVQQSFGIGQTTQTITFTSTAPNPGVAGTTYTPTATASSGLPVAFSVGGTGCTFGGGLVHFTAAGTCLVNADQAGGGNYLPAVQKQQSIMVKLPQTITFTSTPPTSPPIGGTYTPTATATSALAVTFALGTGSTGCKLVGGLVTFTGAGTCVIKASQPGNGTYVAAPVVQQSIAVKRAQTISFTTAVPNPGVAGKTYRPLATATSGLPVTMTLDGASTGCSLSAGTLTFTGAGTCIVDANQAGNATWAPATQVQQSITVKLPQTISFTSAIPSPANVGGTYTPTANATSGLPVVFGLGPTSTACSLSAGVVTFTKKGTCVITANQPGNGTYIAAPQVQQVITVR
jgi:hypothetical protein